MSNTKPAIQNLESHYREYISTINALTSQTLRSLHMYLDPKITIHNNRNLSPEDYTNLIILDSTFNIVEILTDDIRGMVAARLSIDLPVKEGESWSGKVVKENVFYRWDMETGRIKEVWSMVEGISFVTG